MNVFYTEYYPTPSILIGKMIAPFYDQFRSKARMGLRRRHLCVL